MLLTSHLPWFFLNNRSGKISLNMGISIKFEPKMLLNHKDTVIFISLGIGRNVEGSYLRENLWGKVLCDEPTEMNDKEINFFLRKVCLRGRCTEILIFFEIYFTETTLRNSFLVHFVLRCPKVELYRNIILLEKFKLRID